MDKKILFKVSTLLSRTELDFLYALEQDIYFNHHIRIPRSKLIQEIIAALSQSGALNKDTLPQELLKRIVYEQQTDSDGTHGQTSHH